MTSILQYVFSPFNIWKGINKFVEYILRLKPQPYEGKAKIQIEQL